MLNGRQTMMCCKSVTGGSFGSLCRFVFDERACSSVGRSVPSCHEFKSLGLLKIEFFSRVQDDLYTLEY